MERTLPDVNDLGVYKFRQLPLVVEGESKEVRYLGNGLVAILLKPTVYSFTHQRARIVLGTDMARLHASRILHHIVHEAGVKDAYLQVGDQYILADLVLQPVTPEQPRPFRPNRDMDWSTLRLAPPIEVVVKIRHTGTSFHRYHEMVCHPLREIYGGATAAFEKNGLYPEPLVRFDWRNPVWRDDPKTEEQRRLANWLFMEEQRTGQMMPLEMWQMAGRTMEKDEVLGDQQANWFIDVAKARETVLKAFHALQNFMRSRGLEIWDICFFVTEDGEMIFGEISPDCMRVRLIDDTAESFDKDVFRAGGSDDRVAEKWNRFVEKIS